MIMQKILFAIIAAVAFASCAPLKIAMNQTGSDGSRYILTSNQHLFNAGKGNIEVALGAKVYGRDTLMAILITCDANVGHGVFNKGNKLMFRLKDNSEIVLTNLYDKEYEETQETNVSNEYRHEYGWGYAYSPWMDEVYVLPYEVTRTVPRINTYTVANSYALYLISKPQMHDIITKGIVKIRVEVEDRDLDTEDTEGFAEMFHQMCELIKSAANEQVVRTKF